MHRRCCCPPDNPVPGSPSLSLTSSHNPVRCKLVTGHRATSHHLDPDGSPIFDEDASDVGSETAFAARGPNRGQQRLGKARRPTEGVVGATVVCARHPRVFDERRSGRRCTVVAHRAPSTARNCG